MIEQVVLGTLDMSLNTQGQLENHVKASATPQIPFIFDDYEHAHRTMDGPAMPHWIIALVAVMAMIVTPKAVQ